jgi:hypothetical protein
MRAAEWSAETSIEYQENVILLLEMGEAYHIALVILKREVGGGGVNRNFCHRRTPAVSLAKCFRLYRICLLSNHFVL